MGDKTDLMPADSKQRKRPLRVAWISLFPIEWLAGAPPEVRALPKEHPSSWQRVLLDEFRGHAELDLHVIALRKELPRDLTFELNGVTFHCLQVPGGWRAPTLFWLDTWIIRRRLKAIAPDVVHAWGTEKGAALVASRLPHPYLVTLQGLLSWYAELVPLNRYDRFMTRLEKTSLRRASILTTECTFSVAYLRNKYPHLEVVQAEHAPDWLFHRLERRCEPGPPRLIFVGTIGYRKGVDLLVKALDLLRNEMPFRLTIIGSGGEFLARLRSQTSSALWDRVEIHSQLTPREVAVEMTRATLMVFPTRADTSPNAVKESVVAGLPVVASALGGILDYVVPGRNGFTFQAGSLEGLTQSIRAALRDPMFSRGDVDAKTLARMRGYLSPRMMADTFLSTYQHVLGAQKS